MTALTSKAPAAKQVKVPGPVAKKVRQTAEYAVRAITPYVIAFTVTAVIAVATRQYWLMFLTTGAAGWHALLRLHEAYGWHRRGGRVAARKRRRYQGPASYRERRARLSLHAIRQRAHVTRPATDRPHKLPASDLGVLIGQTVRRSR